MISPIEFCGFFDKHIYNLLKMGSIRRESFLNIDERR